MKTQNGVNIISYPMFRLVIINLVGIEIDILDNSDMIRIDELNSIWILPNMEKYFYRDLAIRGNDLPLTPGHYDASIHNPEFDNICKEGAFRQRSLIIRFANFNKLANDLISGIESEIQRLK